MFKQKLRAIVRAIQKGLAVVLLFILYIFGFGAAFILSFLFGFNRSRKRPNSGDSFWAEAAGYDESPDELTRQS